MLKKVMYKLSVILDILKGFLINILVIALIIFFSCMIVHTVLKLADLEYEGEYKKLVKIDDHKMMNVATFGEGEKTIVILPGFGFQAPTIQYKGIVDKLKETYKVVVVEYYGYGLSSDVDFERSLDKITSEIKSALANIEVYEFVLMPHSISNIYAMKMVENYPSAIQGIISLDGTYPSQYEESYFHDEYLEQYHNVQLTSILEWSGFARVLSYLKTDLFNIPQMQNEGIWGDTELEILRYGIAESYLTKAMVNEMKMLEENAKLVSEFKYPENLPVLQLIAQDTINEFSENKKNNSIKKDAKEYASSLVTNPEIQLISVVEGNHQMQYSAYKEVAEKTFEFLETGNVTEKEEVIEVQETENIDENKEQDDNAVIENTTSENTIENTTVVVKIPANKPKEKEPEVAPITGNVLQNQTTTKVPEEPIKNETVEVPKVAEIQGGNPEKVVEENKTAQEPEAEEVVENTEEEEEQEEIVNEAVNETAPDVPKDGNVIKLF